MFQTGLKIHLQQNCVFEWGLKKYIVDRQKFREV